VKGAKDVGVEFTTMSKPYNMAGWRIGFAAGNKDMLNALATIKGYYDYGIFQAIQIASIVAMRECDEDIIAQNLKYQQRRDIVCEGLEKIGWEVDKPRGSMFVWAKIAEEHLEGKSTLDYSMELMESANVSVSPGRAFGENGEGYIRIALVENEKRLKQALRNISRFVQNKPLKRIRPNNKT